MQRYCNKTRNTAPEPCSISLLRYPLPLLSFSLEKGRMPRWLGRMRFDERHPGLLRVEDGVVIAALLRCPLQEVKAPKKFQRRAAAQRPPHPVV